MKKRALITGITGQDGSYLAEFLLKKGYIVHGLVRRSSTFNRGRIEHIYKDAQSLSNLFLHYGDMTDATSLMHVVQKVQPDEIYNLAAQSHVQVSFEEPEYTANSDALGALRLLEAMRILGLANRARFYQASTSELFGLVKQTPQTENTPFYPRSPYGAAKLYAYSIVVNYREAYGMYACNGILFNHESPRRGENFVTRKITLGIADILSGKKDKIYLGNLDARRDWGYAPEYVESMWLMLQQDKPDDYVIATGQDHSIREFLTEAFRLVGVVNWKKYVGVDHRYKRPTDVELLVGDASKAKKKLGWQPKIMFRDLVYIMLEADLKIRGLNLETIRRATK